MNTLNELENNKDMKDFVNWLFKNCEIIKIDNQLKIKSKNETDWNKYDDVSDPEDLIKWYYDFKGINRNNYDEVINNLIEEKELTALKSKYVLINIEEHIKQENLIKTKEFKNNICFNLVKNKFYKLDSLESIDLDKKDKYKLKRFIDLKYYPILLNQDISFNKVKSNILNEWLKETSKLYENSYKDIKTLRKLKDKDKANLILYIYLKMISGNNLDNLELLLSLLWISRTNIKPDAFLIYVYGKGGEGKSELMEIFKDFVGIDNYELISDNYLNSNSQFLGLDFKDKTILFGDEIEVKDSAFNKIKNLTSQTCELSIDRKNKSAVNFNFYGKVYINTNILPSKEILTSDAMLRRIRYFKVLDKEELKSLNLYNDFTNNLLTERDSLTEDIVKELDYLTTSTFLKRLKETKNIKNVFKQTIKSINDIEDLKKQLKE